MNDLIDIGANLTNKAFFRDLDDVIERARNVGIGTIVITGTSLRGSREALKIAQNNELYCTVGIHPHDAKSCNEKTITLLRDLAEHPYVVAIGECGLDYNRDFSPRPVQNDWFSQQIELACELNMPLFLHERDAHQAFVEILERYNEFLPKCVVHCFTGTAEELEKYLELGFYIGITGWICDERRGLHLRELVKKIPLNRLMIETDSPFLTPRNIRPKPKRGRNEPAFLTYVLEAVAECTGKTQEEIAQETTKTTREFFGI